MVLFVVDFTLYRGCAAVSLDWYRAFLAIRRAAVEALRKPKFAYVNVSVASSRWYVCHII